MPRAESMIDVLLVDNYDSFTYNLSQQISSLGVDVRVVVHDELTVDDIVALSPKRIVISPGPKTPDEAGISLAVIERFYKEIPILGVCLGHQCMGQLFGAKVVHAPAVVHGQTSAVHHTGKGLFKGVGNPFDAARYHSLVLDSVPDGFVMDAWTDDRTIMAVRHQSLPIYGVQFHPESFMTEHGAIIMRNFLT